MRGIERHARDGRPKIYLDGKGKYYSRVTNYIDVLDDKTKLVDWKLRKTLEGAAAMPLIIEEFGGIEDPDSNEGKRAGDKLVTRAMQQAGTDWRSELGTALHELSEDIDKGEDPFIPPEFEKSMAAYVEATKDLEVLDIEAFVVNDEVNSAGTFDRLVRVHGELAEKVGVEPGTIVVADVKTFKTLEYGRGKVAMQIAIYARGKRYDPVTHERTEITPLGEVDLNVGLIIWLPSDPQPDDPLCAIVKVDIAAGWEAVLLAREVREHRNFWNRKAQKPPPALAVGSGSELN